MGRRLRTHWSPRYAWALPALLLLVLGTIALPSSAQVAASYKPLHAFPLPASGLPVTPSSLVQAADGDFYGTIYYGGAANLGGVFRMTPTGAFTLLYSFTGETDGANPVAGLIQGSDGNFYGTTRNGGPDDLGTIFKLEPGGTLTTLLTFTIAVADGAHPWGGLLRDSAGNLYGTTNNGGVSNLGTIFKLEPGGTLTTLHTFTGADGAHPLAGLIRDSDGNLYGTTYAGGASSFGTVFKLTPSEGSFTLTTLHTFTGTDGTHPNAGLIRDSDGNLYGTTYAGGAGASNYGTVFKLTPRGGDFTLTTLHTFTGTDGSHLTAGLIRDTDGTLYGTTNEGGASDLGTVFKLTPSGDGFTLTTLHTFTGTDGAHPYAGLIQGSDGYYYGTTSQGGGTGQSGVAFVLRVGNTLTLTPAGTGEGTVTSVPAGISCPDTCSEVFPPTAPVTLTATAATGSTFTGWNGEGCSGTDPCTVAMSVPRNVTATFTLQTFALSVAKVGTGTGTVTSTVPNGAINCGSTCSAILNYGTSVTLTAAGTTGSTFSGWSGSGITCPGIGTCTVEMTLARTVTATFQDTSPPTITHTPITSRALNTPIVVTAIVTDNGRVEGVTLFYQQSGASSYTSVVMTRSGSTFSGTIPGSAVTKAGVLYYLEARDAANNIRWAPSTAPATPYSVVVGTTVFTDDPLVSQSTTLKAVHFTELRTAITALWTKYSVPGIFPDWGGPAPAIGGPVRAAHLVSLRTALDAAYFKAKSTHLTFDSIQAGTTPIKASHLNELRTYVRGLE